MSVLETPRLRMRPFAPGDAADHRRLYDDPEVTRFLPGGPFPTPQVADRSARTLEAFVRHWAEHGFGVWALIDRATGQLIGQCGLKYLPPLPGARTPAPEVEVLYALARERWGGGLATEAAAAALAHGFETLGLPRIVALTRPEHRASRAVMEKLGLRHESEAEVFGLHAVLYAIGRDEFLSARRLRGAAGADAAPPARPPCSGTRPPAAPSG